MPIFAILFQKQAYKPWRGGRVVDYGSLENCWAERLRGFESLPLRKQFEAQRKALGFFRARPSGACSCKDLCGKSPKAVRPGASNSMQGPTRRAERDVAHAVRQIPRRGRDSCKGPSGERKGKENLQPPQLPILHPIRAEPLNHIAYLTHKYFCSYKKL